jgi:hypothetical protein
MRIVGEPDLGAAVLARNLHKLVVYEPAPGVSSVPAADIEKWIASAGEPLVIKGTGEVITYADGRIKNSPDGEFHWCSVAGANDGHTVCLFVPPRGF